MPQYPASATLLHFFTTGQGTLHHSYYTLICVPYMAYLHLGEVP